MVYFLVPPDAFLCAWLILQLFIVSLQGFVKTWLWEKLVETVYEVGCADVVEIEVFVLISYSISICVNHLLGIAADIFLHSVVTICQPSVEHTLQLYSHYIRPLALWAFRRVCEVEIYRVGIALHLAISHPFRIMSVERQFSKNLFAVDDKILEENVMRLSCPAYLLITDTVEGAVFYIYIIYLVSIFKTVEEYAVFRLLTCYVLHVHIPYCRDVSAFCYLLRFIYKVYTQNSLAALSHLNISHIDAFCNASATGVCLYAKHAIEIGGVHLTIFCKDILHSCRNLRAHHNTSVSVFHSTSADDDILRRCSVASAVSITSRLDGNAVVTGMEDSVFYQYVLARLRVAAVAVRAIVDNLTVADGDVL